MSAASRLARADKQIIKPHVGSNIGLNTAGIPGGISALPRPEPIRAGGLLWGPADAEPWACSIGYALAAEHGQPTVDLVKRTAAEVAS